LSFPPIIDVKWDALQPKLPIFLLEGEMVDGPEEGAIK
jgi:hypothetical protein